MAAVAAGAVGMWESSRSLLDFHIPTALCQPVFWAMIADCCGQGKVRKWKGWRLLSTANK
jgi:hypothetical protein